MVAANTQHGSSLDTFLGEARKILADGAIGPTMLAPRIMKLAEAWDRTHKPELDGLEMTTWLRQHLGHDFAYWSERARAVERLGVAYAKYMHHEAAIYISKHVSDAQLSKVCNAVLDEFKANGRNCVTRWKGIAIARDIAGCRGSNARRQCSECDRLRGLLETNGIEY